MVRNLALATVVMFAVQTASAAMPYVRVLLPLYIAQPVHGAYGSLWSTQFVVHNASSDRQYLIQTICDPSGLGCAGDITTDEEINPGQTKTGLPPRYRVPQNPVAGALVLLLVTGAPPGDAGDLRYNLRVVDQSRGATAAGTEVPVVREAEFHTGTIHLLNVPTDQRFRLALRVFEMNLKEADFSIRVFDQASNALLSEQRATTTTGGVLPQGFTPGFVELDNFVSAIAGPVRIEVDPITPGVAFWSYVSITNNDSQQITLVTPQ